MAMLNNQRVYIYTVFVFICFPIAQKYRLAKLDVLEGYERKTLGGGCNSSCPAVSAQRLWPWEYNSWN